MNGQNGTESLAFAGLKSEAANEAMPPRMRQKRLLMELRIPLKRSKS